MSIGSKIILAFHEMVSTHSLFGVDRKPISGVLSPALHQEHPWPVQRATNQDFDIGHRNFVYAERNLLSVSWPKQPPELRERPGLRGPQPAQIEYRPKLISDGG